MSDFLISSNKSPLGWSIFNAPLGIAYASTSTMSSGPSNSLIIVRHVRALDVVLRNYEKDSQQEGRGGGRERH
jgi:hypothetical protein